MIRYLLDEHVDPLFQRELIKREPGLIVWVVGRGAAPPKRTSDQDLLIWCEVNGYILVTNNRKTMPVHLTLHLAQGRHIPGIVILSDHMSIGEILDELHLIWMAGIEDDYKDRIAFLPV